MLDAEQKSFWALMEKMGGGLPGRYLPWSATTDVIKFDLDASDAAFDTSNAAIELALKNEQERTIPSDFPWTISQDKKGKWHFKPKEAMTPS